MRFYQAALPLSTRTLTYTARLIRAHRKTIGSRWQVLDPGAQALLTLAYLRHGHTYEHLAPGFGISRATAARRINEVIDLLSAQAPRLRAGRGRPSGRAGASSSSTAPSSALTASPSIDPTTRSSTDPTA